MKPFNNKLTNCHIGKLSHWLIFALVNLLILNACSKKDAPVIPDYKLGVQDDYTWDDYNLKGKVKKLTIYTYGVDFDENGNPTVGELLTDFGGLTIIEFSPQSLVTQIRNFEEKETEPYPISVSKFVYDDQNRLTTINSINGNDKIPASQHYTYDADGFISSYYSTYNNKASAKELYTHNRNDKGELVITQKNEGDTNYRTERTYNPKNLVITEDAYDDPNQPISRQWRYIYNADNRLEKCEYEGFGEVTFLIVSHFSYDKYGNITMIKGETIKKAREDDTDSSSSEDSSEYTYDSQGNVLTNLSTNPELSTYRKCLIEYY